MHKLTIPELDDFEADHVSEILHDYKIKLTSDMLDATANSDQLKLAWLKKHLVWA